MKISDLYAEISFRFDTVKLHEVMTAVSNLNLSSVVTLGSMALMGEGVKKLIDLFSEWNTMLSDTSNRLMTLHTNTGIPTKFAQQFENVSYELGASKEAADATITKISQLRRGIMMGEGVPQQLQMMGFSVGDLMGTNENMVAKLNQVLSISQSKMTLAQREHMAAFKSWLSSYFGGPEMLQVFESKNLMGQINQAAFVPKDELQASFEATVRWRNAVTDLNNSFMELGSAISPLVVETAKIIENLAKMLGGLDPHNQKADTVHYGRHSMGPGHGHAVFQNTIAEQEKFNAFWKAFWSGESHASKNYHPENGTNKPRQIINIHSALTVNSQGGKDVVKEIEASIQKILTNASREFGLGAT
jgi:hypothetical protein